MDYNLLLNGVYWGYNPPTNHLLTSWDIQAGANFQFQEILNTSAMGSDFVFCNGHIWGVIQNSGYLKKNILVT